MYKNIIIVLLITYAIFGGKLLENNKPKPEPKPTPVAILNIDKPSDEVISRVKNFSDLIKDPSDRAKIAIFNYEFATRVVGYNTSSQQVNDVYSLAGKTFFANTLVNKYDNLSESIVALLESIITSENHILSQEEKNKLNQYFMGVAWVLIQKG
jgi:hypothetical protein